MHSRTHRLFLLLITLALAVAPLRGTWALPESSPPPAAEGSASHCEQMQHGQPASDALKDMHAGHGTGATGTDPCNHDCGGTCCDATCSTCAHVTAAIPGSTAIPATAHTGHPHVTLPQLFPERPAIPPLHPPAALHS